MRSQVGQRTRDVICTNVNDNDASFEPGALDELGLADSGDEDVCLFDLGVMSNLMS